MESEKKYRAFIGEENADIYIEQFKSISEGKRAKFHWPAFLFGMLWLLYRKMYGYAIALLGVGVLVGLIEEALQLPLPGSSLGIQIALGFMGYRLYKNHADSKIASLEQDARGEARASDYSEAGGSTWAPVAILMLLMLCLAAYGLSTLEPEADDQKEASQTLATRPRSYESLIPGA